MDKKPIKNYIYNMVYQVVYLLAPLVVTPYISRVLGAENIGIYSYTTSIITYFTMFSSLGLTNYGIREVAYNQKNKEKLSTIFCNIQTLKFITSVIAVIAYFLYIKLVGKYEYLLFIQGILLLANFFDITWFFQGVENFRIIVLRNIIIKTVGVVMVFVLVKGIDDLAIYTLIQVVTILIGNISLWLSLSKHISFISVKKLNPLYGFKEIIELFIPVIAVQVYNVLDKTMIGITGMMDESGYYEQATKTILLAMAFITSISGVMSPRMAAKFANKDMCGFKKEIGLCFELVITIACPVFFGVVAVSNSFVDCFFGPGYEPVKLLLRLYGFVLLIVPLSNLASYGILTPIKKHNLSTIATIIAELVVTLVYMYFCRAYIDAKILLSGFIKKILLAGCMSAIVYFSGQIMVDLHFNSAAITIIQIFIGIIIYCAELFLIKDKSIVLIKQFISKKNN